jgi:hypothetical protein
MTERSGGSPHELCELGAGIMRQGSCRGLRIVGFFLEATA